MIRTAILALSCLAIMADQGGGPIDEATANRFARLALDCIHRPYPNKIAHVMLSDADAQTPQNLTPMFFGCFDWHSAVHGHWLLVRLLREYPNGSESEAIEQALKLSFTADHVRAEVDYLSLPDRASFERPYGLAWLLQLCAELREWDDVRAREWSETLKPLELRAAQTFKDWLPKLSFPIRTGEHSQSAFALGLVYDWSLSAGDHEMQEFIHQRALQFHQNDWGCGMRFEPSGQDFLSPCLAVADLMRRVMAPPTYAAWLGRFMPEIPFTDQADWLELAVVTDPSDGKLAHLDGLNLSRAWMLEGIASGLPVQDPRIPALESSAKKHLQSGLASVTDEHYEGSHWKGSFAIYALTKRGLSQAK